MVARLKLKLRRSDVAPQHDPWNTPVVTLLSQNTGAGPGILDLNHCQIYQPINVDTRHSP